MFFRMFTLTTLGVQIYQIYSVTYVLNKSVPTKIPYQLLISLVDLVTKSTTYYTSVSLYAEAALILNGISRVSFSLPF